MTSTSYPATERDWKGQFIRKLVGGLSAADHIALRLWSPPGEMEANIDYCALEQERIWLHQLMKEGGIAHLMRNHPFKGSMAAVKLLANLRTVYARNRDVDVIHVNWLQNALPLWGTDNPAVISVLGSDIGLLKFPGMVSALRRVIKRRRCFIAPNAEWMIPLLARHFGDIAEIAAVPFGVDSDWFSLSREYTAAAPRKWLVVSRLTARKIGPLFAWGKDLFDPRENQLHLLGPMQEQMTTPDWVYYHGATNPFELQRRWLPDATGLITSQ